MPEYIIAIDPGNIRSAYVLTDAKTLKPLAFAKVENETLSKEIEKALTTVFMDCGVGALHYVIEDVVSYGMKVGRDVFDTVKWIGMLEERYKMHGVTEIERKEEKLNLCHSMKATDANIIQALVDRFARGQKNYGKGTKAAPGWFYGFHADIWQAYAVAVTFADKRALEKLEARKNDTERKNSKSSEKK